MTGLVSPLWTVTAGEVTGSAAALGIANIGRERKSTDLDTCVLTLAGRAFDAAALFTYGTTVTIQRDDVVWFVGRVTSLPASGGARAEGQTIELAGPWWYLENLVCRQEWKFQGGTVTALLSRLILGQALDGTRLTTGGVITEALQYAIDSGAPLALGTIDPDFNLPFEEVKDVTCAEVVKKMLRWHPDCVTWFDYTTTPNPTLHVRQRANLTAVPLTVGQAPLAAVGSITARTDLVPPAVVIHYEITNKVNGASQISVQTDAAPTGATGQEFGAVVMTIPMRGTTVASTTQRVVTRAIRDSVTADTQADLISYLAAFDPGLAQTMADPEVTADGIAIVSVERVRADRASDGAGELLPADAMLGNHLVSGAIADWMIAQGVAQQRQVIQFTYTADHGDGTDPTLVVGPIPGTITLVATSAGGGDTGDDGTTSDYTTTTYSTITSASAGDTVPAGLAAAFLATLSRVQYQGRLTLIEAEVSGAAGMGNTLNLTGAATSDWATMQATIATERVDVASGTTVLDFGPLKHLSLQDLAAILQLSRPSVGARNGEPGVDSTAASAGRSTGLAGTDGEVGLGVYGAGSGAGGSVAMAPMIFDIAVNGVAGKVWVNAGAPVPVSS